MVDLDDIFDPDGTVEKAVVNSQAFWEAFTKLPPDDVLEIADRIAERWDSDPSDIRLLNSGAVIFNGRFSIEIFRTADIRHIPDPVVNVVIGKESSEIIEEGTFEDVERVVKTLEEAMDE